MAEGEPFTDPERCKQLLPFVPPEGIPDSATYNGHAGKSRGSANMQKCYSKGMKGSRRA